MMLKGIPNLLTVLRIVLIPILVMSFLLREKSPYYVAAGIFIFASITDYLDGQLARIYKAQTNLGRVLDPIADKMLVASTLLMLVNAKMAPIAPTVAILCREIFVSGMREYLAEIKVQLPVSFVAKIKTALQMVSICFVLLGEEGSNIRYADKIGYWGLWVTAALTLFSGYVYFRKSLDHLSCNNN
ncbi:CDP-diacylglycerol--glycerol-3-phosphate 3-phosphatidyltransferase [Alphaproteobacteria bacterium]